MKRALLVVATTTALAAGSVSAVAQKPRPYTAPTISITATPNPTVFSVPVKISGRVSGDPVTLTLQGASLRSGPWANLASATTPKNGRYSFSHRPSANIYYRVISTKPVATQSPDLLVRVRTLVGLRLSDSTPSRGQRVRFSGIVRPRHNGRRAYIQKRSSSGRWTTVARTTLRALDAQSSRYSVRLRIRRSGVYRARVLGHADHAMGISRERTATVG